MAPGTALKRNLLACPYCYQRCAEREIEFRCAGRRSKTGNKCETRRDEALFSQTGFAAPVFPAFDANGRHLIAVCPGCGGETNYRICPNCHSQLPVHFGKIGSRLIAMIGAKETGKTVYMTVLLHELIHRIGAQYDAAIDGSDDPTRDRFAKEYEQRMYENGELFDVTRSATVTNHVVQPLVFRFTTAKAGLIRGRSQHTLLSFFDTAGEDLRSQELVDLNARYLCSADGIILLLDPLQMQGAQGMIAAGARVPTTGENQDDPANVLSRVTDLLRSRLGLKPTEKIATPVAVVFSKIDALWHQFDQGSALRRPPPAGGGAFDTRDSLDVHYHVQALLHQWEGSQMDQLLEHNYRSFRYFAVSALGETPTPDNKVPARGIRPYRVGDPFVWLLSELSVVKATTVPR